MNRLREIREKKGVSQEQVAKAVHTTRQAISLYEHGEREPKLAMWHKLANYFKVSTPLLQGVQLSYQEQAQQIATIFFNKYIENKEQSGKETDSFKQLLNEYCDSHDIPLLVRYNYETGVSGISKDIFITDIRHNLGKLIRYTSSSYNFDVFKGKITNSIVDDPSNGLQEIVMHSDYIISIAITVLKNAKFDLEYNSKDEKISITGVKNRLDSINDKLEMRRLNMSINEWSEKNEEDLLIYIKSTRNITNKLFDKITKNL
ncbi:helix-turn-helix transcriptional regulator [Lactiplantibacillus plantarum]|uniref:helix-turn-helix transcriptional regulator n=2 Tax=Lactiplantibacillus plantarum TaxID=1590 RepID=UPI001BAC78EB|nr:helix-turn-helix transcriptional regulator [Lactiplantibacillus plantarum]MBS0945430.1 helix-turn-helix transcriptional regulator [Lactiplantibacillus plantarum]